MGTAYETDIAAWANEQAALLRQGRLAEIDALNVAEEIEDVAKSERRQLGSDIAVLVAHLLKWKFQSRRRGSSWEATIRHQRDEIRYALRKMPSLRRVLDDGEWLELLWRRGATLAHKETGLAMPQQWIWSLGQVLDEEFWPE